MAIKSLAWMTRVFEPPVYCYHEIVHNQIVVERFREMGVVFVDDVAQVPAGAPLMLSAHGSPPELVEQAKARGGAVVNAVCPLVKKVHHEVKVRSGKGFSIVYVGHEGHQEAIGTAAVAPDAVHRIESLGELEALPEPDGPVAFLAQTTLAVDEWKTLLEAARARWPDRNFGPLLCHHQPADSPQEHRQPLRCGHRDRIEHFLQHAGPGAHRAGGRMRPGAARRRPQGATR